MPMKNEKIPRSKTIKQALLTILISRQINVISQRIIKNKPVQDSWIPSTSGCRLCGYTGAVKPPVRRTGNRKSGPEETGIYAAEPPSLTLFAQCRIQSVYLSHGAVVGRIGRNDVDLIGIVLYTVEDSFGKRAVITAKLVVPAAGVVL